MAWAARDLQYYIEKISGAKLPLHAEGDSLPSGVVQILVGRSTGTSKYDPIIPSGLTPRREEEGYAIVKEGDILVLAGNDAAAAQYAQRLDGDVRQRAETEAWVWVNGKFVGHRSYIEAYIRPSRIDMDLADALIPGEKNQVVVRLHTNLQAAQMPAGLASRLFIYAPYPAEESEGD